MWAATSLYPDDTFRRQSMTTNEKLGILTSIDIVSDDGDVVTIAQAFAQCIEKRGLA
jgi:hypothetical protein